METRTEQPKKMPFSTNKKDLTEMYLCSGLSEREIRKGINEIIADSRKLSLDSAKFTKSVRNNELMQFVETYGLPKGYYIPEPA